MEIIEPIYQWNGTLTKRRRTDYIILHHAAAVACTVEDVHRWHTNNTWSGIGYNFFVSREGKVYRGRPENVVGAHTTNYNSVSIGVCFEGDYMSQIMPQAQLQAGQELITYLREKYPDAQVGKHKDFNATSCPGVNFPFDELIKKAQPKENLILAFQKAAQADGYQFAKYGCDGIYGAETEAAMKKCVVKQRNTYQYKNCTKLVQRLLGITADGLAGPNTEVAIKNFQLQNGLLADGACGVNTYKKLLRIN